jgi:hypothetical protein
MLEHPQCTRGLAKQRIQADTMEPENLDIESITDERRKAIEKTIGPIGVEELKSLGEKIFPILRSSMATDILSVRGGKQWLHILSRHDKRSGRDYLLSRQGKRSLVSPTRGSRPIAG